MYFKKSIIKNHSPKIYLVTLLKFKLNYFTHTKKS